jgi:hypothetical protein
VYACQFKLATLMKEIEKKTLGFIKKRPATKAIKSTAVAV